ncbi:hypothetical protein V8E53_001748 [Lactarius tabidus]
MTEAAMLAQGENVGTSDLKVILNTSASLPSHVTPQLPLELLQRIFLSLVGLYFGQPIRSWGHPSWIDITYVCRYWRSAALDLRELWSFMTPNLPIGWLQAMIERSSPLPMSIIIFVNDSSVPVEPYGVNSLAASGLLSTLASRIYTLSLAGRTADVLSVLNRLCHPSQIESLILSLLNLGDPVDLPESLYGGDAPHLRRLTFDTEAYIRVPLWVLTHITHFTDNMCVSLDRLLEVLEAMPQLEVLCVVRIFSYRNQTDIDDDLPLLPRIKLPRLSLLSVRDQFPNSFLVLSSWIYGPPTLRRHFFWQDDFDLLSKAIWSLRTLLPFIPSDSTLGASDGGLPIAQISGRKSDFKGLFEMWSRTNSESASMAVREDALFLFQTEWSSLDTFDTLFPHPSLCVSSAPYDILDLTIAKKTLVDGVRIINETDTMSIAKRWAELLNNMPSVKTLRLHRGTYSSVSVLRALSMSQGPMVSALKILPHLQRVIITNSAIHSAATARTDGGGEACARSSVAGRKFVLMNVGPELMEVVKERSGLLEVVLAGCEVEEEMLDTLRKRAKVYIGYDRVYV